MLLDDKVEFKKISNIDDKERALVIRKSYIICTAPHRGAIFLSLRNI